MTVTEDITTTGPGTVEPITVAVIGTGAIGQDLVSKVHRSPVLECGLVAGRNPESVGLRHAARLGYPTTAGGIDAILAAPSLRRGIRRHQRDVARRALAAASSRWTRC